MVQVLTCVLWTCLALFNMLMDRQVHRVVVTTLLTRHSLSAAVLKWGNIPSDMIALNCIVRQGGVPNSVFCLC